MIGDISKAFALQQLWRPADTRVYVPLAGLFSGEHDDWFLRFSIVKNLKAPGAKPVKIITSNAGSYLIFAMTDGKRFDNQPFVVQVADDESTLDYSFNISWDPRRRTLIAKASDK